MKDRGYCKHFRSEKRLHDETTDNEQVFEIGKNIARGSVEAESVSTWTESRHQREEQWVMGSRSRRQSDSMLGTASHESTLSRRKANEMSIHEDVSWAAPSFKATGVAGAEERENLLSVRQITLHLQTQGLVHTLGSSIGQPFHKAVPIHTIGQLSRVWDHKGRETDLVGKVINRIDEIETMYQGLPASILSETKSRMISLKLFSAFGVRPEFLAGDVKLHPDAVRVSSAVEPCARTLPLPPVLPPITEAYAAEPISAHSFISNAKGYPVLPKTTQSLVRSLLMAVSTISFVLSHTDAGLHARRGV
ncbi:hypothetical protein EV421DRAFT_1741495 [Armillaria borealis]|uniref:Uncharacterized protein n=1 Tax=Armillaria borealis TaxID=47425 RepID=A0AA39IZV7_9AGAR|nr:hypothetical protein EV421DRAFT_1741495 [Armillaria borealis]